MHYLDIDQYFEFLQAIKTQKYLNAKKAHFQILLLQFQIN